MSVIINFNLCRTSRHAKKSLSLCLEDGFLGQLGVLRCGGKIIPQSSMQHQRTPLSTGTMPKRPLDKPSRCKLRRHRCHKAVTLVSWVSITSTALVLAIAVVSFCCRFKASPKQHASLHLVLCLRLHPNGRSSILRATSAFKF